MFEPFWHHVYVRAESRTFLTPCLCSSEVENPVLLVYVRAFLTPCLCSSGVENLALLYSLFMFERSREPCATLLPVYVRAESRTLRYFTPCLCSSGVENPALLVYVRAESRTLFQIVTLRTTSYLNNECHFYILKVLLTYPSSDRLGLAFLLCSIFWFFSQNKTLDQRRWMFQKTWVLEDAY